jgi:hypothetical protein
MNGEGGVMVQSDGRDICAGFFYTTNSAVAWVDWIISDKQYRGDDRKDGIILLIRALEALAQGSGASCVYALIKHNGLKETYKELGFLEGDTYNSEMIKWLHSHQSPQE